MNFKERYTGYPMAANATLTLGDSSVRQIGGFICSVAGTITVASQGVTLLNAHPVAAGQYLPLPILLQGAGGVTVTLAGGAAGLFLA